jgi:hypothetical protein
MTALANPSSVVVDPSNPSETKQVAIVATVLSDTGIPQKGFTVYFTTDGGTLASNSQGIKTDSSGVARDTLTVGVSGSGDHHGHRALVDAVGNREGDEDAPRGQQRATAKIVTLPTDEQAVSRSVSFDASTSTDPDAGDSVATYAWSITSSAPDPGWTNPQTRRRPSSPTPQGSSIPRR